MPVAFVKKASKVWLGITGEGDDPRRVILSDVFISYDDVSIVVIRNAQRHSGVSAPGNPRKY